jgi:hypothetical protein
MESEFFILAAPQYLILLNRDTDVPNEFWERLKTTDIHVDYNIFIRHDIPAELITQIESRDLQGTGYGGDNYLLLSGRTDSGIILDVAKVINALMEQSEHGIVINAIAKMGDLCIIDMA